MKRRIRRKKMVSKMLNTDKYIYKIEDSDIGNPDFSELSIGWYFSDEGEQMHGPFSSRQEALDSLDAYFKWLSQ